MEYAIIGVICGMFVIGTSLLIVSHFSSEPSSRHAFNTSRKNTCARVLNIFVRISGHARIQEFCQRGSNSANVFFCSFSFFFFFCVRFYEGRVGGRADPNTTISGPSSARQQTPFKWRFASGPMMAWFVRGCGPVLLRNPIYFFQGVRTPCPPLNPHMVGGKSPP